ncbi:MAG: 7-carboxy-7-deazaguanine synthase [Sphingobacteriales bacterium]|jgi:7-carboxy-7-deazaguanine synthase
MNTSIEKSKETTLPIMEQFYTVQGEGMHQGTAAYFIRLGGCDVGCIWCDVKDSWDASVHPQKTVKEIVADAKKHPSKIVVITGGEPLMYDLTELCQALHDSGFKTHIETSAAYEMSGAWEWICVSPKKFKAPKPEALKQAHELKVIVYNKADLNWATAFESKVNKQCALYLQPEWDKMEVMMPLIIEFVKANPHWKISLQCHKFMNIP